jgi:hypothetical protein
MKIQATELTDARAEFVSVVTRGANRRPWKLKKDDTPPGMRYPEQGVPPRRRRRRKEETVSDQVSQGVAGRLRQSIKTMVAMLKGVAPNDPLVQLAEPGGEVGIQQFVFSKDAWAPEAAAEFAGQHGFKGDLIEDGPVYRAELFPADQIDPNAADQTEVWRADDWPDGVTAIKALQVTFAPGALSVTYPAKRSLIGFPPASVGVPKTAQKQAKAKTCPTCGQPMPDDSEDTGKEDTMTADQKVEAVLTALQQLPAQVSAAIKACSTEHPGPRKPKMKAGDPDEDKPGGDEPAPGEQPAPAPAPSDVPPPAGDEPGSAEQRLDKVEAAVRDLQTSIKDQIAAGFAGLQGELGDRVEKVERRTFGRRGSSEVTKTPEQMGRGRDAGVFDTRFPSGFRRKAGGHNQIEDV